MRWAAGEVALVTFDGAGERLILGDAEPPCEGAPVGCAALGIGIAQAPVAVDPVAYKIVKFVIGKTASDASAEGADQSVVYADPRIGRMGSREVIASQAAIVLCPRDLIWRHRVAGRARAGSLGCKLSFSQRDLMLELRDCTGQKTQSLPVVRAERLPEFGLADNSAKVFGNDEARVIPTRTVDEMPDLACHDAPTVCNQYCNHRTAIGPWLQGINLISRG